jgi:hypothetical protein
MEESAVKEITNNVITRNVLIVTLLVAGSLFAFIWNEYVMVNEEKQKLNEKALNFEKYKYKTEIELNTKAQKLEVKAEQIKMKEGLLTKESKKLTSKNKASATVELEKLKYEFSIQESKRVEKSEDKLVSLMSEFSSFGIDLNSKYYCKSDAHYKEFKQAEALYSQIYATAEANKLKDKYQHFFFKNGRNSYYSCKET